MKQLCSSKYALETADQEVLFIQQQINYYNSPSQSSASSSLVHSSAINSIQNPSIRQQFSERYKAIAEHSKATIFSLYLKTAEHQRDECKQRHEADMKKIWSDSRSSSDHEKMPTTLIHLIEQRCNKISERIQCVYRFKVQSLSPSNC